MVRPEGSRWRELEEAWCQGKSLGEAGQGPLPSVCPDPSGPPHGVEPSTLGCNIFVSGAGHPALGRLANSSRSTATPQWAGGHVMVKDTHLAYLEPGRIRLPDTLEIPPNSYLPLIHGGKADPELPIIYQRGLLTQLPPEHRCSYFRRNYHFLSVRPC